MLMVKSLSSNDLQLLTDGMTIMHHFSIRMSVIIEIVQVLAMTQSYGTV